jgi:hypothetical protein
MANETSGIASDARVVGGPAPGLVGVYGRLRVEVAGKSVGTLVIDGPRVGLTPDTTGPADAILVCSDDESFRKLLKGELNPFVASMRGWARIKGDRNFGTKVMLGLRVGSPFTSQLEKGA